MFLKDLHIYTKITFRRSLRSGKVIFEYENLVENAVENAQFRLPSVEGADLAI